MRPLEGITVVSLEQVIAGPFATRQLAELGARVIKIERTGGGDAARGYDRTVKGQSSHFVWTNRSKESVALDAKHPAAREILARLMERADVFVQNLAPGAAERLGLGAQALRERHPSLVWCGISGYGPSGPYAEKKAYDLLVQCEAGLLSVTGTPEAAAKAGIPVADIAAGMYAFSSILAALIRRQRTGEGATLDITMFEALGEWMGLAYRRGRDARHHHVRGLGRVDGLSSVLHCLRGSRTRALRRAPRHHRSLRSIPHRRWLDGVPQRAERARVRAFLRNRARRRLARPRSEVFDQPGAPGEPPGAP
jgi:crotonobetainyl-CoA:carnitine CoA-transferase CaiB-like acyl-CoA transferase